MISVMTEKKAKGVLSVLAGSRKDLAVDFLSRQP